jgi:hypothetical protein
MTINVYVTSSIVEHAIQSNLDLCSYALREGIMKDIFTCNRVQILLLLQKPFQRQKDWRMISNTTWPREQLEMSDNSHVLKHGCLIFKEET